jgi:hypothetical protein
MLLQRGPSVGWSIQHPETWISFHSHDFMSSWACNDQRCGASGHFAISSLELVFTLALADAGQFSSPVVAIP